MRPMSPVRSRSFADHHLRGLIGAIPVTGHHLRTAHADLADLVDAELIAVIVTNADFGRRDREIRWTR